LKLRWFHLYGLAAQLLATQLLATQLLAAQFMAPSALASSIDRGREIFGGGVDITATLRGDQRSLPKQAARCLNCHTQTTPLAASGPAVATVADAAAPPLTAASLTSVQSRRRGPPSRFDQHSFCRLLTTGIDAADILVRRTMPIYDVAPADCAALWLFLTHDRPEAR
jgi:hypothetical protein